MKSKNLQTATFVTVHFSICCARPLVDITDHTISRSQSLDPRVEKIVENGDFLPTITAVEIGRIATAVEHIDFTFHDYIHAG